MEWWFRFWRRWLKLASRIFLFTGMILLVVAAGFWAHEWRWSRSAAHATGTVTEMEARQDAHGQVAYFPHFRFRLPGGELVQVVSRAGREPDAFNAGQQVPVFYHSADPQNATIATRGRVYSVAIVLGIVGAVLFDLGAVLWIIRRRREIRAAA